MTTRTADRMDDWESRPFSDGYDGLRTLADRSFSGAVTTGRATLFMLNGSIVGILEGVIEDYEDATGTIYEAPSPALPLLGVMQARGDEVRAKYYSEETPLSEADQKLKEGGFTGYVELSENVLSGDYYVVYHGGKSMSVAFVGESERLVSGDEAFEQADDEVGIYKVRPVPIEPVEIPEPESDDDPDEPEQAEATATAASGAEAASEDDGGSTTAEEPASGDEEAGVAVDDSEPAADTEDTPDSSSGTDAGAETDPTDATDQHDAATGSEPVTEGGTPAQRGRDEPATRSGEPREADRARPDRPAGQRETADRRGDGRSTERREADERGGAERAVGQRETTERGVSDRSDGRRDTGEVRDGGRPEQRQDPGRRESPESDRDTRPRGDRAEPRGRDETRTEASRDQSHQGGSHQGGSRQGGSHQGGSREASSREAGARESTTPKSGDGGNESSSGDASLERRTIPSVDPERTWTPNNTDRGSGGSGSVDSGTDAPSRPSSPSRSQRRTDPGRGGADPGHGGTDPARGQSDTRRSEVAADLEAAEAEIADLERRLEDMRAREADLEAERDDLLDTRDQLEVELEDVRQERDDLQAEVEDLRNQVSTLEDRIERAGGDATTAETTLTPAEAIDETNLFVRYVSKGEATLKSAHGGSTDAEEVNENLNLEYHTQFDAAETAVNGQPYDEFLVETIHYRFVEWVVRKLLYEIQDTGHESALEDLYDALPKIDRAELNASVTVEYTEDGEEQRTQETFDVVLRDRMGNPLVVTNLNDSRQAATEEMMTELVTTATRVGESNDELAGAFFVTSSFFDPDALETASEATGGGILSRDKRESFVRLSRKGGFHLCLVESRDGDFHLAVPEL